ncbi:MAG: FtsX-like permease family protein [Acidobacteria bacterium]|nr:FtsX-like permease family protein [Acidobacteriota bacterium]
MGFLRGLADRARNFFRRSVVERELDEEIRFHLEREIARHRAAGRSHDEARRIAERAFGGVARVKDMHRDERGVRWLVEFFGDVRFGLRGLRSQPTLTAVALLALGLGVGGNAAVFSVLDALLLRPLPFANPEQLVVPWQVRADRTDRGKMTAFDVDYYREYADAFSGFAGIQAPQRVSLVETQEPEQVIAALVTTDFFDVLGVAAARGRAFVPADEAAGETDLAVLSYAYWQSRFAADPGAVGRTVTINGRPTVIVGVMPASFRLDFPADVEMWLPRVYSEYDLTTLNLWGEHVIARLAPGVTIAQARDELKTLSALANEAAPRPFAADGFSPILLHEEVVTEVRPALLTLLTAVVLVLLIACANVANLLLARNTQRADELALRAALGAGRARLTRQLLAEHLALAGAGVIAAVLVGQGLLRAMLWSAPADLPRVAEIQMDLRAGLFTGAVALVAMLLFGTLPALRGGRAGATAAVAGSGARGTVGRGEGTLNLLVAAESALVVVLVFAAGAMLQRYVELSTAETGFQQQSRLAAKVVLPSNRYDTPAAIGAFVGDLEGRLRRVPGVAGVGGAWTLPLSGRAITVTVPPVEGEPPRETELTTGWDGITPGYFQAAGIPIVEGRTYSAADVATANPNSLIINETLARELFGDRPAVGQFLANAAMRWQIIGVVGDTVHLGLDQQPRPHVYQSQAQVTFAWAHFEFVIETNTPDPLALAPAIRRAVAEVDPQQPVADIRTLETVAAASIHAQRYLLVLLATFGGVALMLGAIGIYGVVGYGVARRNREMGLRLTLGASPGRIRRLVLRQGLGPVAGGVIVGSVAAALGARALGGYLAGAQPSVAELLSLVVPLVLVAATAAVAAPMRRAATADPMQSLRDD